MLSENDRRAERERREQMQDEEAAAAAAELKAAEAEDEEDDFDIDKLSSMIEALALGAAEPDMDLTDAVEMDSLEDLAEAEAGSLFGDEE